MDRSAAIIPLWSVYHRLGLGPGIGCSVVHLILVALELMSRGMFRWEELLTPYRLARLLLTGGGGIVWAVGAAGPPLRQDVQLAFYNNIGLIVGVFVIFLGFAAFKDELHSERKGALAGLGHATYSFSFFIWIIECLQLWARLCAPTGAVSETPQPDWHNFIYTVLAPVWDGTDIF